MIADTRRLLFSVLLIALLLCGAGPVAAQEPFAAYPPLPVGYRSIKVFDAQQRFVGRLLPDKRYWVSIDRIPLFLQKAVIAVEDARFYEHGGIDLRGIARAAVKNVVKGRMAEGGSTITQQLIKNRYLSSEKTLDRKVNEGLMAIEFEKQYTKRQILEMYLNEIYYGNGAWGIAQAARIYFDKSPDELSDAECTLLAGIPKNPARYNPLGKPADVSTRRGIVITRMAELGMLSARQAQQLRAHSAPPVPRNQAPYYLGLIRSNLQELYGPAIIEQGGLEVTAALHLDLQQQAEQLLREGVSRLAPDLQAALVSLDPVTGDLLALVGGTDFAKSSYNRALYARRQPGSAIKPLLYAAALEQGVTAASIWDDAPVVYPRGDGTIWTPHNYGDSYRGALSLRQALSNSSNVVAVKLLDAVGIPAFTDTSARMGLLFQPQADLSLALGTQEVTLQDLSYAYAPLANGGQQVQPRSILRIYDHYRRTWTERPVAATDAISPGTAFIVTQMLKDVLTSGTAKGLRPFSRHYPAAGKTGTTSDYRDAWFIGYTPRLVTGVWVGHDQPRPGGKGFTGGAVAAPLWERFMRHALQDKPAQDFTQPGSVVSISIDPATGNAAPDDLPTRRDEYFIIGTEPISADAPEE